MVLGSLNNPLNSSCLSTNTCNFVKMDAFMMFYSQLILSNQIIRRQIITRFHPLPYRLDVIFAWDDVTIDCLSYMPNAVTLLQELDQPVTFVMRLIKLDLDSALLYLLNCELRQSPLALLNHP